MGVHVYFTLLLLLLAAVACVTLLRRFAATLPAQFPRLHLQTALHPKCRVLTPIRTPAQPHNHGVKREPHTVGDHGAHLHENALLYHAKQFLTGRHLGAPLVWHVAVQMFWERDTF